MIDESLLSLYENSDHLQRLKRIVLKAIEFNSIESAIFTLLHNWREHIITKKKMKEYYTSNGTIIYDRGFTSGRNRYDESTLDDMENFIEKICNGEIDEVDKYKFFLPKLTEKEVQMVEDQNIDLLKSFACYIKTGENPDITPDDITPVSLEQDKLESKSKFLRGGSRRFTLCLKLQNVGT